MKNLKNKKIYTILTIAILLINVLLIVIYRENAGFTVFSIPAIIFAVCSVIYAVIAILFRNHFNLFYLNLYILAKLFHSSYNETQEYKDDFIRFAFIYCGFIPFYITASLFVDDIFSGITAALYVTIAKEFAVILTGLIPPSVRNMNKT